MEPNPQRDLEDGVREVIARVFQLSSFDAQGDLRMGNPPQWDSMGHMELVIELETAFGLTFPTYAMAELVTVGAIRRAIEQHRDK
ncbi:MAG: acyl carrier protein [Acidobacteriota bacterium]